jgi:CheY-like chemotaxis protein
LASRKVYGIAQQSGGTIRIESDVGIGTKVALILPAASEDQIGLCIADVEAPQPERTSGTGATVLVIDDDSDVRAFLAASLEALDHHVVEAENGEQGLKRLVEHQPDLILLDYAMPGMHGADVARAVRHIHADLPIIFVTGYAETEQLEAALGADVPILRKPFTVAQLAGAVDEQLPRKKGVSHPS